MKTNIKPAIDPAFAPLLQWSVKLVSIASVIGWCCFLLALAMAQFGTDFGPSGRQLKDTVSDLSPLMFGLLVALSLLSMVANKLARQTTNVATSVV